MGLRKFLRYISLLRGILLPSQLVYCTKSGWKVYQFLFVFRFVFLIEWAALDERVLGHDPALTTIVNAHRKRRLDDLLGSAGELWSRAKTANLKPRSVDRRHGGWVGKSPTARSLVVAGCLWSAAPSVLVVRMGAVHIHISRMAYTVSGFCMARERQPPQHRLGPFRQQHRRLWPLGNNPH